MEPQSNGGENYFRCHLPGGQTVDLLTTHGADAFLGDGSAPFISSNLKENITFRRNLESGRLNSARRQQGKAALLRNYIMFGVLADNASPEKFARVPSSELESLIQHVKHVFGKLQRDKHYLKTGSLLNYDQELLDMLICMCKHHAFVKAMMEQGLMNALAEFVAARTGTKLPSSDITESVLSIFNNCRITLMFYREEHGSQSTIDDEAYFRRAESCGLLAQVLRCYTQPSPHPQALQSHLCSLDALMECGHIVKKKLKSGDPTGDILRAILDGRDGYKGTRNEQVLIRLKNLLKMAQLADRGDASLQNGNRNGNCFVGRPCRYCDATPASEESQSKLLLCARCKGANYCNKECQKADWKEHRKTCQPVDRKFGKVSSNTQQNNMSWVMQHYFNIMKKAEAISRTKQLDMQKAAVLLDFKADSATGVSPALQEPPQFAIEIATDCFKGERPAEPDWFYKGHDVYEKNIQQWLIAAEDHYQRMTPDHLLVFYRSPDGGNGVNRVKIVKEETKASFFSNAALRAFCKLVRDNDDSEMMSMFGKEHVNNIQRKLDQERFADLGEGEAEVAVCASEVLRMYQWNFDASK